MINIELAESLTSAEAFCALARRRLAQETTSEASAALQSSDFALNPAGLGDIMDVRPLKSAAVLVPILARPELTVLFTLRTDDLPSHAGQISFPGGKIEAGESAAQAALREAHEEIGLAPQSVEPLGFLGPYATATGYLITPLVALVPAETAFTIAPREVADVFEVPLSFVLNPRHLSIEAREWRGINRRFYVMRTADRYIWGATAGIIAALQRALA